MFYKKKLILTLFIILFAFVFAWKYVPFIGQRKGQKSQKNQKKEALLLTKNFNEEKMSSSSESQNPKQEGKGQGAVLDNKKKANDESLQNDTGENKEENLSESQSLDSTAKNKMAKNEKLPDRVQKFKDYLDEQKNHLENKPIGEILNLAKKKKYPKKANNTLKRLRGHFRGYIYPHKKDNKFLKVSLKMNFKMNKKRVITGGPYSVVIREGKTNKLVARNRSKNFTQGRGIVSDHKKSRSVLITVGGRYHLYLQPSKSGKKIIGSVYYSKEKHGNDLSYYGQLILIKKR